MKSSTFTLTDLDGFKKQALCWAASFSSCCCYDSNGYQDSYSAFDFLVAAGTDDEVTADEDSFAKLQAFLDAAPRWSFGFLSYDLKNELEDLSSGHPDHLGFPRLYFFSPRHLLRLKGDQLTITAPDPDDIFHRVVSVRLARQDTGRTVIGSRISKEYYVQAVSRIKEHILRGDVYEMNFCQEFFSQTQIDPVSLFLDLNEVSPSPFAVFFRHKEQYLLSATPERFLSKRGNKLISQPIKGTAPRHKDPEDDRRAAERLKADDKEKAENVMIVDLVRNDLTRCAIPGSVRVEELFGIYSFSQVHQMISTVVCDVDPSLPLCSILKPLFPMGSMTGAPKLRAMELIEQYELSKRGLFSGAAGYFTPEGDFDFNVVIRSLLYNAATRYLSFQAGSAITFDSDPEKEYEECLVKVGGIRKVLGSK